MKKTNDAEIDKIKQYFEDGLSLTRYEAMKLGFGFNLPARVYDLRKEGMKIMSKREPDNHRIKRYYLKRDN